MLLTNTFLNSKKKTGQEAAKSQKNRRKSSKAVIFK
jgi:hypothetical protein